MLARRLCVPSLAGLLLLAGWGVLAKAQPPAAQAKVAAVVNGESIPMSEVQAVLEQRPNPVPLSAAQQKELRQAALDALIDDLLMRQFLKQHGGQVQQADFNKEITELQDVLKKQNKTLADFLRESKQTEDQLRQDIVARLQWKNYLRARYPEKDIGAYYQANKVFFDRIMVRASHILVKVPSTASASERQTARAKLETLRNEILAGKIAFTDAAKKYSDCPSKEKGGDIGPFPYKFVVVEPFAKAAFAVKKNELTDIVTTDFGFHIIWVTDRTAGEPSNFEAIRDGIREVMAQEHELYPRILAEQRKNAKIQVQMQ